MADRLREAAYLRMPIISKSNGTVPSTSPDCRAHSHHIERIMETETSTSLIKGVQFGTLKPGETAVRTLFLHSSGTAGERILDFSIQSRSPPSSSDASAGVQPNTNETLHTLLVPTISPFRFSTEVGYSRDPAPVSPTLSLARYESTFFQKRCTATVTASIACGGPWHSAIESIRLVPDVRRLPCVSAIILNTKTLSVGSRSCPIIKLVTFYVRRRVSIRCVLLDELLDPQY